MSDLPAYLDQVITSLPKAAYRLRDELSKEPETLIAIDDVFLPLSQARHVIDQMLLKYCGMKPEATIEATPEAASPRDEIAIKLLQGMLANPNLFSDVIDEGTAIMRVRGAYIVADAVLEHRAQNDD